MVYLCNFPEAIRSLKVCQKKFQYRKTVTLTYNQYRLSGLILQVRCVHGQTDVKSLLWGAAIVHE